MLYRYALSHQLVLYCLFLIVRSARMHSLSVAYTQIVDDILYKTFCLRRPIETEAYHLLRVFPGSQV